MDPIGVVSNLGSTLKSSIDLATFVKDIKNTPTDVKTCFALTQRINTDLEHLLLLKSFTQNQKYLQDHPLDATRLDSIIHDARQSILAVCKLLEGCRQEVYEDGYIPIKKRLHWVLGDSAAFARRSLNLQGQHAAVTAEIAFLRQLQVMRPLERAVTMSFENVELWGQARRAKNAKRGGNMNGGARIDGEKERGKSLDDMREVELVRRELDSVSEERERERVNDTNSLKQTDSSRRDLVRKPVPVPTPTTTPSETKEWTDVEDLTTEVDDDDDEYEEEDPEVAFYRDLRRQEDERQRRMVARRTLRNLN